MTYKAFISYSHAADGQLAPLLQSALHRFAKPFLRLRAMRVFRDATSLHLTPALWPAIRDALRDSEHFILMASPAAAASEWVRMEIREWLGHEGNPRERLFVVLTEGTIVWDRAANDFDWTRTTALPPEMKGVFAAEPFHLDFCWARESGKLSTRNPRFLESVSKLAAALHGRPLDELTGEDIRQHRLVRMLSSAAIVSLLALSIATGIAAWRANTARAAETVQRKRAEAETARAEKETARAEKQAVVANRERIRAEWQTGVANEQTRIANEQRQTAEERQVQLQQNYSDTAFRVGQRLLERGETAAGVAHLANALEMNPANAFAADRLYTLIAMRDQPVLRRRFRLGAPVTSYDVNPAGDAIVAVAGEQRPLVRTAGGASAEIVLPAGHATHVQFLDDDAILILADDGSVLRARRTGGKATLLGRLPSAATTYALSPTGDRIAAACAARVIAMLPLREGATATKLPFAIEGQVGTIGFVRGGTALMVIATDHAYQLALGSGAVETTRLDDNFHDSEQVSAIAPDGTWLSTCHDPGGLEEGSSVMAKIRAPEGSRAQWAGLDADDASADTAQFNADGTTLTVTLDNDEVHLFDASGGSVTLRHVQASNSAPHPKRDLVYTSADDGSVIVWSARTGKAIAAPLWHAGSVDSAKFAAAGNTLAVVTHSGDVSLWDLSPHAPESSKPLRMARQPGDEVQHGNRFILRRAAGNTDEHETAIFELLDARTKKLVRKLEYEIRLYDLDRFHGSAIAKMSEDESVVVTIAGGDDPQIWSPASPAPIGKLDGMGEARDVHVTPAGDRALIRYEQAYGLYSLPDGRRIGGEFLRAGRS
ncbi:MAG TPA: TIR domain-containing protein [Thermoanaerobaculia bacterium]|nr:TIR domain-containing protein [Thermoanaerobaculia bacterium]